MPRSLFAPDSCYRKSKESSDGKSIFSATEMVEQTSRETTVLAPKGKSHFGVPTFTELTAMQKVAASFDDSEPEADDF